MTDTTQLNETDYMDDELGMLPRGPLSMKGRTVYVFTIENILAVAEEKQYREFVWPVEGKRNAKGDFVFHKGGYTDEKTGTEIGYPTAPLMVDMTSAHAFSIVYKSLNEKNQAKTRELAESHRGLFVWVMNEIVWPNVR
jgi:hypothetical protein